MSECLQPLKFEEFIDLSEEARLIDSICPNKENPVEKAILKNSTHLKAVKIKHEENHREIKKELEEKRAKAIHWYNEANKVHKGKLKSFDRLNDKYEGEIKCGVPHGQGLYIFGDGISYYNGEFEFGKYNGFGILHLVSGDEYIGGWYKNFRSNFGKQIYENGESYEGNWNENKFNEYGVYSYKDGSYYNGNWSKGFKEGNGVFNWADGTVYDGTWSYNDRKKGVIYYPNGCRLEGKFCCLSDTLHKSKFFDTNGACFKGLCEDIYNKYLQGIDCHLKICLQSQIKEKKKIEAEEEKRRIEIAEEKKRSEISKTNLKS